MSGEERAVVYDAIHEVVPPRYQLASVVGHEPEAFPLFIDQQTQLGFYLVFGQRFLMGATAEEIAARRQAQLRGVEDDEWIEFEGWMLRPEHEVDAAPFFAGEAELDEGRWIKIGVVRPTGQPMPESAREVFAAKGWRLPAEAELELLRLTPLERLDSGQCEDDWHEDYAGAPSRAVPWGNGREVVRERYRHGPAFTARKRAHRFKSYRPCFSLFPAELGYSAEAVAARAAEPVLRSMR
jgi:hypothetical protein